MAVFLLAIGLAGAQFYAPAPLTPVQYTSANYPISAQPYEAQLVYIAAPGAPVETSSSGASFISGVAFVAGLSVTYATLAHHVQKKATKHHEHSRPRKKRLSQLPASRGGSRKPPVYPETPDVPWMTVTMRNGEQVNEEVRYPAAAL